MFVKRHERELGEGGGVSQPPPIPPPLSFAPVRTEQNLLGSCQPFSILYRVYKKKLHKPEIAHRLCKAPQCTKFFIEIGCFGTNNVV